jgi:hypothetical protein
VPQVSRLHFDVFQQLRNFLVVLLRRLNVWTSDQQRGRQQSDGAETTAESFSLQLRLPRYS